MKVRIAKPEDNEEISKLFRETVIAVNSKDYSEEEIQVWAGSSEKNKGFLRSINEQFFFVAEDNNTITGFGSITNEGYLDFLYVHMDYQRMGVASLLLNTIEKKAGEIGVGKIFSYVSRTARPFFEKRGYVKTGEKINKVKNIEFVNNVMEKNFRRQ